MISGKTLREIRFRNRYIIPKGDVVRLTWPDAKLKPCQVEVHHGATVFPYSAATSLAWIGLTVSMEELESAVFDGTCETPSGVTVEPDGVDSQGVPSWLAIHSLI